MDKQGLDKLKKLMNLADSPNDNEALCALRAANRIIKKSNLNWAMVFEGKIKIKIQSDEIFIANQGLQMHFGKHRGLTLKEIYVKDRGYLVWAKENLDGWMAGEIASFLEDVEYELTRRRNNA